MYIDEDDSETQEAIDGLRKDFPDLRILCCCGTKVLLAQTYNILYMHSGASIMFSGADDIVFRTQGWDDEIRREFASVPDQILLVYGDDCLQREKLCTHPFISRRAAEVCGYFYPNIEGVSLTDIWLFLMYKNIDRLKYRADMVIEHMHWTRNLASYDETYAQQHEGNLPYVMAATQQYVDVLTRDTRRLGRQLGDSDGRCTTDD